MKTVVKVIDFKGSKYFGYAFMITTTIKYDLKVTTDEGWFVRGQ